MAERSTGKADVATQRKSAAKRSNTGQTKGNGPESGKVTLLSGGNPQIPKGDGDAPVQAYINAMPEWKQDIGRRLDTIIVATVPGVRKAVKWNTPFYGKNEGWFLSFHCFTKYIKVTFFRGTSLGTSKHPEVRYLDIREGELDETQFRAWVLQASQLPGEKL